MKFKAIVIATVLGLFGAAIALAAPPAGKGTQSTTAPSGNGTPSTTVPSGAGKPSATGPGCKPSIAVILKGTLAGNGGTVPFALSVNVTGGNKFAAAFKNATQPVSVQIAPATKIQRQGDTNAADLKSGDVVNVRAHACKADLVNGATPSLTASHVVAHAATA